MDYKFHTEPFKHQKEAFIKSKDLEKFAILWEQGVGKTKLAIDTACYLYLQNKIDAVLVVASNGVHRNWVTDELPVHISPEILKEVKAEFWESSKAKTKQHQQKIENLVNHKGFSWMFISYDAFITELGKEAVWKFLRHKRCFYVLDEAHNIKSPKAKTTKSIVASAKYASYRRILTGTPISQGAFDIYTQMKFLDENFWKPYGLGSYTTYKFHFGKWLTRGEARQLRGYDPGYDKFIEYKNIDELQKILLSHASRETKESAGLNLPPKLYSKRYHDLSPLQAKLYKKLKEDYIAELENGKIVDGTLAVVRLLRLQQIVCGYAHTDDEEEPIKLINEKNPRIELLKDIVEQLYHPAIIWARFTKDIDQIMDFLGDRAVRYDGKVTDDEAAEAKEKFQKGKVQFFVGNPAKGKEGLTLIQARTVIYYSNSFKLIDRLQSEDRAHRIGQKFPVDYIDICCPGTVDDHIIDSLVNKLNIASQITGDNLKEWL